MKKENIICVVLLKNDNYDIMLLVLDNGIMSFYYIEIIILF